MGLISFSEEKMTKNKKIQKVAVTSTKKAINLHSDKLGGLYDPKNEHDSCGLGFIANINGVKSHKIIQVPKGVVESRINFIKVKLKSYE